MADDFPVTRPAGVGDSGDEALREQLAGLMYRLLDDHGLLDMGLESEDAAEFIAPAVSAYAERRAREFAATELEGWARSFRSVATAAIRRDNRRVYPQVAEVLEAGGRDLRDEQAAHASPASAVTADEGTPVRRCRMTASSAARDGDNDELRAEIVADFTGHLAGRFVKLYDGHTGLLHVDTYTALVDELADVALRRLTAERDQAQAAIERVRAVLATSEQDAERSSARMFDGRPFPPSIWHGDLRRALDGGA